MPSVTPIQRFHRAHDYLIRPFQRHVVQSARAVHRLALLTLAAAPRCPSSPAVFHRSRGRRAVLFPARAENPFHSPSAGGPTERKRSPSASARRGTLHAVQPRPNEAPGIVPERPIVAAGYVTPLPIPALAAAPVGTRSSGNHSVAQRQHHNAKPLRANAPRPDYAG